MAIDYYAPADAATRTLEISIYAAGGQRVRTLYRGPARTGEQREYWNGRDDAGRHVASGVYFCRVQMGAAEAAERLIVLR
jgi:flagellar hook assembly protein FlgD